MRKLHSAVRGALCTAGIFALAVLLCVLLQRLNVPEHITTVMVFAVFLISLLTDGYVFGVVSALLGALAVNYAFTYPYFALDFLTPVNLISAGVLLTIAVLTGTLTTKLKRQEAARAEAEAERTRANLLRAVSHDLRTPLTTIYSASSTLLDRRDTLPPARQEEILRGIREDAEWLTRMVENLLSITRIDSGAVQILKAPTVLDELIDSVMTKFAKRYPGQAVRVEIPEEIVVIPMDATLIEQVLINLLENAVLHAAGMTELCLRVRVQGGKAVFEVADNGCGIPEEQLSALFSGLAPGAGAADGRRRSAGIGLSVCATIVRAHGGAIRAENRREGGAVFRFALQTEGEMDAEV